MFRRLHQFVYCGLLAAGFLFSLWVSWSALGQQIDSDAYDFMFRMYKPDRWQLETAILGVDEATLRQNNGLTGMRRPLTRGLEILAAAKPKAVGLDIILSDHSGPQTDANLAAALAKVPNLVLSADLVDNPPAWEDPLPEFRAAAKSVGHVHTGLDKYDAVNRAVPLELWIGKERRWALAFEAYRLSRGGDLIESPESLDVAGVSIPTIRQEQRRMMRIRYLPPEIKIPEVGLQRLLDHPELASIFTGKVVFVGYTAQTLLHDRWTTPYSNERALPGVQIHANILETLAQQLFITDLSQSMEILLTALFVLAVGLAYSLLPGWRATAATALILAAAHLTPYLFFKHRVIYPFLTPVFSTWMAAVIAAAYVHLVVRRSLAKAEADTKRYQQTFHFVTHELRTPLTAIQGSSELISRYGSMPEAKRKEMAQLINAESKRLGRLIQTFLDVERLSAGQMELKKEPVPVPGLVLLCVERARPLADRKQIQLTVEPIPDETLTGDGELLEYALYNLINNAIKYSPKETEVTVLCRRDGHHLRLSVNDQGIGMNQKEVRQIFQKFYRTKSAEQSGEVGTGIGLSIVENIVTQHGGVIEVTSQPGKGSCFTLVMPVSAAVPHNEMKNVR